MARDQANDSDTWIVDWGASHHITLDLQNLSLHSDYGGNEDIMIGDGNGIPITHVDSTTIEAPTTTFRLTMASLCEARIKETSTSGQRHPQPNHMSFSPTNPP
ncbi:Retrovirus-related Pol polyprotein from transposon RE1 [Vitis vinifera]|uniref:Retrovirus-related Pol polyprotein from transposon RE1 n=1 Tax=Vitis vinifera TaxID=29760 RepID=A0A438DRH0_VITVI|nr:Retrovirus-related Pol polyprotein from transposon RE1 [Vitis vinifera]